MPGHSGHLGPDPPAFTQLPTNPIGAHHAHRATQTAIVRYSKQHALRKPAAVAVLIDRSMIAASARSGGCYPIGRSILNNLDSVNGMRHAP